MVLLALTACQSNNAPLLAEQTDHASQSVYLVEFQSASQFSQQAQILQSQFAQYCHGQSDDISALQAQWHQTMLAWMSLQGQERGPADALAESWNIQFWPDKKNTTGRKMMAVTRQDKVWTVDEIAASSVTVQGLGAVEWLLYDTHSPIGSDKQQTCNSAVAISQSLANRAGIIQQAWQSNPWKALNEQAWLSEYIALLSNQLEFSMSKLTRPMANIGNPRPYFSESWRSQTSLLNLKANLKAMKALYLANGDGLDNMLRERDLIDLADRVKSQYVNLVEEWPEDTSLFTLLQSKEGYREVLSQYNKMDQLKYLLHDEVSVELGVVIGFNATDGD